MRKRDLEILHSIEKFKCLERDQIAVLHFSNNTNPIVTCNRVLKRLRDTGYIQANTDRAFQQYIYFLNPSPIKNNSQKIDHYLMIAQGYIDLNKLSPVISYDIEPKIKNADFVPDVKCEWLGKTYFLEFQNSLYTVKQMYSKLDKYKRYFDNGYCEDERVLIVGRINMSFDVDEYLFKVKQVRAIRDLSEMVKLYKEMEPIKCVGGGIKHVVG